MITNRSAIESSTKRSASASTKGATRSRRWAWGLTAILLVAAMTRLWGVGSSPGWFLDEGTYFDVARNLLHGKRLVGQMEVTFAAPHMTAPPAWFAAEALWMGVFGETMTAFRWLVALCGVACVGLTAAIGRRLGGWKAGLWAAAFLAVAPRAILYSRMAIAYTPATMLALLWFWAMLRWESSRAPSRKSAFLILSGVAAALLPLTLYYGIVVVPAGLIWAAAAWLSQRRSRRGNAVPSIMRSRKPLGLLLPPLCGAAALGGFLLYGWLAWGDAFRVDLRALGANASPASIAVQFRHWWEFLVHWTSYPDGLDLALGIVPLLGFAGLLFLRRGANSLALAAMAYGFTHVVLRRGDSMVAFIDYPMTPVLPFVCLGLGMLAGRPVGRLFARLIEPRRRAGTGSHRTVRGGWGRLAAAVAVWAAMAMYSGLSLSTGWTKPNPPTLSFGMIPSLADARAAADRAMELARQSADDDEEPALILASTDLWPLLTMPHSDVNQLMAARGKGSGFYDYDCAGQTTRALREERIAVFIEGPYTELRRQPAYDNPHKLEETNPWIQLARAIDEFHRTWPVLFEAGPYKVRVPPPGDESR